MEDEDVDYLGGVIEFGDGTQYNVQQSKTPGTSTPTNLDATGQPPSQNAPVSKAERFADDFDRNWPRSRPTGPSHPPNQPPPIHGTPLSPTAEVPPGPAARPRPAGDNRALFNERSNRLEPYAPAPGHGHGPQKPVETRPSSNAFSPRDRQQDLPGERGRPWEQGRREPPTGPAVPFNRDQSRGSENSRRWETNPPPPNAPGFARERSKEARPRGDMGPPAPSLGPRELGRDFPSRVPAALPPNPNASRPSSEAALSPTSPGTLISLMYTLS